MSVLRALDRKLLRDLRRLWSQALAIALVLAAGVLGLLMSLGISGALEETQRAYYERNRFAEVFASVRRAPQSLMEEIAAIPGALGVEARVSGEAMLDLPDRAESAVARILSLPESGLPELNLPLLRQGRWPDPGARAEVVVNAAFAEANGFRPGDGFEANLNGVRRHLTIAGTALSPEFIYTIGAGALMPDNRNFGIVWMPQGAAAAAFDLEGAFNDVSLSLAPGTRTEAVIDRLDRLLAPYGGTGAYDRSEQLSHSFVESEIRQLRALAVVLPPVFLGIAAFLVNMVVGRIVALERSEIGLLKALGYTNTAICLHYLVLAGLVAVGGIVIGWAGGTWAARAMTGVYARFYDFPYLIFRLPAADYALAAVLGLAAALTGAIRSALAAARLPPATAMAPPAPPRFRRSPIDRALAAARMSQPAMMVIRSVLRWPLRSGLSALGFALAVALLVATRFMPDALDRIIDTAFYRANRQDVVLTFTDELPLSALASVAELPGVLRAEGQLAVVAELRNGPRHKRIGVEGRPPGTDLSRIIDAEGRATTVPEEGLLLSDRLAEQLDVAPGDRLEVEFLGRHPVVTRIPVAGTVTQYLGLGAYMDLEALNRLFDQAPRISSVNLSLDSAARPAFHAALKDLPRLAGRAMMDENRREFMETIHENVGISTTVYAALAVLITFGVAYNGARVQLSERARELASLRILGFGRAEVSLVLVGETLLLALAAQPLGWALGWGFAWLISESFTSDLYAIPLTLRAASFAYSSLVVLGAAVVSVLVVRRRVDRLDLVAVMKARE